MWHRIIQIHPPHPTNIPQSTSEILFNFRNGPKYITGSNWTLHLRRHTTIYTFSAKLPLPSDKGFDKFLLPTKDQNDRNRTSGAAGSHVCFKDVRLKFVVTVTLALWNRATRWLIYGESVTILLHGDLCQHRVIWLEDHNAVQSLSTINCHINDFSDGIASHWMIPLLTRDNRIGS